jgi:hypothetical protein
VIEHAIIRINPATCARSRSPSGGRYGSSPTGIHAVEPAGDILERIVAEAEAPLAQRLGA